MRINSNEQVSFSKLLPLYFLNGIGATRVSLIIAVLTPILVNGKGYLVNHIPYSRRLLILSCVLSLYPLGQFLGTSFIESLSRKYGKKNILFWTTLSGALCFFSLTISIHFRLIPCIVLMCFLTGLSDAMYVVSKSIITDLVKNINQRALYFSYLGSSGTLGFIISPLLAFCLVNNDNPLKPNISLPFLVVSIGQLIAAGIFATTFSETEKKLLQFSPSYHSPIRQVREALAHPLLKVDYQLNLFVYLLYFLFMAYYPIYLTNHYNLSIQGLSYYLILATLVSYCSGVFISKVLFRHFTISTLLFRLLMLISIACFLFTMALFIVGSTLTLAATVMLFSLALPCAMSILSQSSPDKEQGEVIARSYLLEMGAQSSMGFLAGALASLYLPLGLIIIALGALLMALNKHKFIKA